MSSDKTKFYSFDQKSFDASELNAMQEKIQEKDEEESDEEDDVFIVDPFQHRLTMSTAQWAQSIILGIILVPVRLVLIVIFMLLMWIVSSVSLRLVAKGKHTLNIYY